jgi:hypothetical protein
MLYINTFGKYDIITIILLNPTAQSGGDVVSITQAALTSYNALVPI